MDLPLHVERKRSGRVRSDCETLLEQIREEMEPRTMTFGEMLDYTGYFGKWHILLITCLFICACGHMTGMFALQFYLEYPMRFHCIDDHSPTTTAYNESLITNVQSLSTLEATVQPANRYRSNRSSLSIYIEDQCSVTPTCENWHYSKKGLAINQNMMTEWSLYCTNPLLFAVCDASLWLAAAFGSLTISKFADTHGRQKFIIIGVIYETVTSLAISVAPSFSVFMPLRFLNGLTGILTYNVASILACELTPSKYRALVSIMTFVTTDIVRIGFAIIALYTTNWRVLQFVGPLFVLPGLVGFVILGVESPRWLLKVEEVGQYKDLVSTPYVRKVTLTSLFMYPIQAMLYFAIYCNASGFTHETTKPQIQFLLFICACTVIDFGFYFVADKLGRRLAHCGSLALVTGCLVATPFLGGLGKSSVGIVGIMGASAAQVTLFLRYTELSPTAVRSVVMGVGNCVRNIGAAFIPFIDLTGDIHQGWLPFVIYATAAMSACLVAYRLPETKGKDLRENMDDKQSLTTGSATTGGTADDASAEPVVFE